MRASLFRSFQKERKSAKRANRSFALFFALFSKKERFALFEKERLPNPGFVCCEQARGVSFRGKGDGGLLRCVKIY